VKKALQGDSFKSAFAMLLGGKGEVKGQLVSKTTDSGGGKLGVGDTTGLTLAELLPILSQALQQEIQSGRLALHMTSRGLTISFTQAALFPSGEDEVAADFYPTIQKIANAMNKVPNPVRAEGHTDSVPIHNSRFRTTGSFRPRAASRLWSSSPSTVSHANGSPSPAMPTPPPSTKTTAKRDDARTAGWTSWS
jgi:chemotaxis protein MotB